MKYYFDSLREESCYPLKHHLEEARKDGDETITLFEAIPHRDAIYAWCKEHEAPIDRMDSECGKSCPAYNPCNGKSGMCRHQQNVFYEHGREVVFDANTGKEIKQESPD